MAGKREVTVSDTDARGVPGALGDAPLTIGRRVDRYVIMRHIGHGGFGVVYEAYDADLDRRVAIKVLRPERLQAGLATERLKREAQALARLSHPNVVTVHDVGALEQGLFVAMELVDGQTLGEWLAAEPRPLDELLDAFVAAGRGLAAAHAAGIVHRDFKPGNVLMGKNGSVRVADFGLARSHDYSDYNDDEVPTAPLPLLGSSSASVTRTGTVLGTPAYMAPEQERGERVDARSDQYSFAAALSEALADRDPPAWLRKVIERGLAARREDRFPDMNALLAAIAHHRGGKRRRWLALAVTIALAGVAALWLVRPGASGPPPCTGFERHLQGSWDAARRAEVQRAFASTGAVYAEDTFKHVAGTLDAYAGAWVGMRRDACLATRVRGEQSEALLDLRMACLDRRLAQLRELTGVLAAADRDVVTGAAGAVDALEPLSGCADAAALSARLPAPADPALAPRIQALRAQLDRADALGDAGKYAEALALARPAEAEARAIGWPALTAEALYVRGNLERLADANAASADAPLSEAARQAGLAHDDARQAHALLALATRASEAGDGQRALAFIEAAEAAIARAGNDERLHSEWLGAKGEVLEGLGRHDQARAVLEEALALIEKREGPEGTNVAETLTSLSAVNRLQGRFGEARAQIERTLAIWQTRYGPTHPNVAITLNNLGALEWDAGDLEAAEQAYADALALKTKIYGPDNLSLATTLMNLGNVSSARGRYDEAEARMQRALAIRRAQLGDGNAFTLECKYNLAVLRRRQGRLAEALALHREVLAAREQLYGHDHDRVANSIDAIAAVLGAMGKHEAALAERRRALAVREKIFGLEHPDVAESLAGIASMLESLHRCREANAAATRSLAIYEQHQLGESYGALFPLEILGLCELHDGNGRAAADYLQRAVDVASKAGAGPDDLAELRKELARARRAARGP
jgi:eukaryotic-like serine/threonine-protein kinase